MCFGNLFAYGGMTYCFGSDQKLYILVHFGNGNEEKQIERQEYLQHLDYPLSL